MWTAMKGREEYRAHIGGLLVSVYRYSGMIQYMVEAEPFVKAKFLPSINLENAKRDAIQAVTQAIEKEIQRQQELLVQLQKAIA